MKEDMQLELLKMAVQVTETILKDNDSLRNDALYKAQLHCKDKDLSEYMQLLIYVKDGLSDLLNPVR